VWAAIDQNPASWRLAEKLGFAAVDELVLFVLPADALRGDDCGQFGIG
jgi:RimJ/RimL family protein N-acetyltransferase